MPAEQFDHALHCSWFDTMLKRPAGQFLHTLAVTPVPSVVTYVPPMQFDHSKQLLPERYPEEQIEVVGAAVVAATVVLVTPSVIEAAVVLVTSSDVEAVLDVLVVLVTLPQDLSAVEVPTLLSISSFPQTVQFLQDISFVLVENVPCGQSVHVPVDDGCIAQLLEVIMVVGFFVLYVPGRHGSVMKDVPSVQQFACWH